MGYEAAASGASALGLSPEGVIAACRAVDREIAAGVTPGAVLAVVRGDEELVYARGLPIRTPPNRRPYMPAPCTTAPRSPR